MKILFCILIIMGSSRLAYSWEDAYEQVWIPVSPDSSFIWIRGGYTEIPTRDVFAKTKYLDSLFGLQKWPRCIFNFHIGKCDKNEESKYRDFLALNHIRVAAIGCRNNDGTMKVIPIWNLSVKKHPSDTDYVFSEDEFRGIFSEANADTSHFRQTKNRWHENKIKNEEWGKSAEGKAYKDSLEKISIDCNKRHSGPNMDCVENEMSEFGKRWKSKTKSEDRK